MIRSFMSPANKPGFFDVMLPGGQNPEAVGLSPITSIAFDMTTDQPNNHIETSEGETLNLGAFERDAHGQAVIRWYSDFKRH